MMIQDLYLLIFQDVLIRLTLFGLIMHELMHQSFALHKYDVNKEEEIITWAEEESYELFKLIKTNESNIKI